MSEHAGLTPAERDTGDVPLRPLLIGGALLAVFVALMLGLAKWMYPGSSAAVVLSEPHFPLPRLQAAPNTDYAAFHRAQLRQLNTAAWTDTAHKMVRVPIDEAMGKLARDGIANWPATPRRTP